MNFKDMPGLENGYPAVMALSIVIIVICILIFKKKEDHLKTEKTVKIALTILD